MRFKLIRQQEIMQCGAACLAMVGTSFGKPVSLRHADQLCGASKQGRIVESGNHNELTAARGIYYNLVKNQLELGT